MNPKDILEAIGLIHRAHCETKSISNDHLSIGGVDIGPSSRYYGVSVFLHLSYKFGKLIYLSK